MRSRGRPSGQLLHFRTPEPQLDENSVEASLTGSTLDGQTIEGIDTVTIAP
jgi:hypothetical protein